MKRMEFEKRVKDENLKMESYDIALDHYYDGHPHFMGCVKKNRKWVIYATNHRDGHAYIIDSYDTEDEAFSDFYQYVLSQIKAETQFGHRKKK